MDGFILVIVGIVGFRTDRSDIAILAGFISSLLLYLMILTLNTLNNSVTLDPTPLLAFLIVFSGLEAFAIWENMHKK